MERIRRHGKEIERLREQLEAEGGATPTEDQRDKFDVAMMEANRWYRMTQLSPHQGRASEKHCWRIFARITHKSIAPANPTSKVIRRHAQVYLDSSRVSW